MVITMGNDMKTLSNKTMSAEDVMKAAKREVSLGAIRGFARYASDIGAARISDIADWAYPAEYVDVNEDLWSIMQEAAEDMAACRISPDPVDKYVGAMYERGEMWLEDNLEDELTGISDRIHDLQTELRSLNRRRIELGKLVSRVWGSMHIAAKDIRAAAWQYNDMETDDVDDWIDITKNALKEAGFERDGTPFEDRTYIADTDTIVNKQKLNTRK